VTTPEIRELGAGDHSAAIRLLAQLNPSVPVDVLIDRFDRVLREHHHYQAIGAFIGDKLVALTGFWIATKVWCGRYLEVDNIVVDPDHRSEGLGSLLIVSAQKIAEEKDCNLMVLDSYTSNYPSHRLYYRLGFEIRGFHFIKQLTPLDR
jgi:ribosomal protein S18 acetylase RimI-like enzyme